MRMLIIILALALATLPFGMGTMMASASASHQTHMADHATGHDMPAQHHQGGKEMGFAVCGSCLSIPVQALAQPTLPRLSGRYLPLAQRPGSGIDTLPATPPPRA